MTESAFELPAGAAAFDLLAPENNSPLVVALCSDEAQGITGQVFHVFGGAVNMLQPWSAGELFAAEGRWEPDALLEELLTRPPEGAAPAALVEAMERVGAVSYTPK